MKIVAMAMFLGEDKVPLRIGKVESRLSGRFDRSEDKVPLRIGKLRGDVSCRRHSSEDKVPLRIGKAEK